jgi:hypothetical protein
MAEALAEFSALCKAWKGGYKRVILTMDCLISMTSCDGLCIGTVVRDFKNMTADTESCVVKFFSRKTNVVAHQLARCAESLLCSWCYSGVYPETTL